MNIYLFAKTDQVVSIKKRLRCNVKIIETIDLLKNTTTVLNIPDDCIAVCSDEEQRTVFTAKYAGRPCVNYEDFKNTTYDNPLDGFNDSCTGLIMGMSHSQCAIDVSIMKSSRYYKMSAPSMDLFLHLSFFNKLAENHDLSKIKDVIIEIPYYIFNYDLSKFGAFTNNKLKYFEIIGNYHHFGEKPFQIDKIKEFKTFMMAFEKTNVVTASKNVNPIRKGLKRIYYMFRVIKNNDKVWLRQYHDTIEENKAIFDELIKKVSNCCPKARITILIMPFNPLFRMSHKDAIDNNRKQFYDVIHNYKLYVVDDFKCYSSPCLFDDHCHLNAKGGIKYTKRLDMKITELK